MADVTLSSAVRSNLLTLQDTARLLGQTQERLATGLKVNSALDDPTAFFTSSSLNSRAGDLSSLLDSLSNGVQTLQAADDGLSAITKTVESLQATVNQARQDASFKSTSFTLDTATIGTATSKNLTFTGGSVGATGVDIALNQAGSGDGTQTSVVTAAAYAAPAAAQVANYVAGGDGDDPADGYVGDQTIAITFGGETANVIVEDANNTLADIVNAINADIAGSDLNGTVEAYNDGGAVGLRTTSNLDGDITVTGAGEATIFGTQTTQTGSDGLHTFAVNGTNVSLNTTTGADLATAVISINSQLGGAHAFEAYDAGGGELGIRAKENGVTALSITGSSSGLFDPVTPGTADTTPGSVKTVDELVSTINNSASLKDKVRASNDNGLLRLENLSTETLTVTGASGATVDGSVSNATISGNSVRKDLITQFNQIRTQLDKLSDDASYNGINLLRGDKLKLNFNESGTSSIEIQAKDADGNVRAINTTNLSIGLSDSDEFSSNTALDARNEALSTALSTLRSQASQFGSNLSIVETRQDFTKNLITTLETGAANLTLADTNEEGANLLALQTRQQLSSVALSLASQADQAVLRLF